MCLGERDGVTQREKVLSCTTINPTQTRERERLSGFDRETDRAVADALRYFNLSSGWLTCCCAFVCVRVVQTR